MENWIANRVAQGIENSMMNALTSVVRNNPPSEPLTVDTIRRMKLKMPPVETWLSSRSFPGDAAFIVEGSGEKFTCAHPGFWLRLEDALRKSDQVQKRTAHTIGLGFDLTPIEIDPWPEDRPETAAWRAAHWDRLLDAVEVAMIPLPKWLQKRS